MVKAGSTEKVVRAMRRAGLKRGGVHTLRHMFCSHLAMKGGIVKLRLTAAFGAQYGGFATDWSPVSWGALDELFVNLTMSG